MTTDATADQVAKCSFVERQANLNHLYVALTYTLFKYYGRVNG